jgi:2-oxoglutarate dehydrogenase E2 component (dihydrolipoamide succinyltransferase)
MLGALDTVTPVRVSRKGFLSPAVRRMLAEQGLDPADVVGTGAGGRITRRDVERAVIDRREALNPKARDAEELGARPAPPEPESKVDAPPPGDTSMPPIEPMRVTAESSAAAVVEPVVVVPESPVDVANGGGNGGAHDEEDTEAAASEPEPPLVVDWDDDEDGKTEAEGLPALPPRREPATVAPESESVAPSSPQVEPEARETLVPFTPMRRRIAENLKASRAIAAHAFCAVEADFESVERVRTEHRDRWREDEGFTLTYLPFVARAVTTALAEFPNLNASVVEDALLVRHDVHLGIAVDLEFEGLIVPVVRDAASKTLREIAREVGQLAEKARGGRLRPDDVAAGTFTITNPGPSGTLLSVPIINQPQVAILATDTVRRRPVMVPTGDGGEGIAVHSVGMLGLSFDHRAVDGLYATSFLSRVKQILEVSDWEAELAAGVETLDPPTPALDPFEAEDSETGQPDPEGSPEKSA